MIKKLSMKKIMIFAIMFCCVLILQNTAFAAQTLSLQYDGKKVKYTGTTYSINIDNKTVKTDFPGIIFNNATMVPLRAVFEQLGGTVVWSSKTQLMDITYNGMKLQFKNNDTKVKLDGKTVKLSTPAKKINDRLIVPADFFKNLQDLTLKVDNKTKTISITSIGSIREILSETSNGKDIITIKINNPKVIESYRLTNPNRIVVDLKGITTSDNKTVSTNLSFVSGIDISAVNSDLTRVTVNLAEMENFSVDTLKDGCKITVQKPVNAKLSYINSYDRVYFKLKDIRLAKVSSTITNYFTEAYDLQNNKYTMTIPASSPITLAEETFNIDDSLISNIEIKRDEETSDTHIVFNTRVEIKFYTTYNESLNQTEINLLIPAKEDEKLVVIDAGHGGVDPGASSKSVYEKDLNLSIALKLEKLLKENNVRTFMLRQDDTFVGLYDRPYIANALKASLFLSIHNNAIDSSSVSGTETLYYPEKEGDTSFTGEKFASLIQSSLISKLGTVNRKTVERPGLVVLKYTKMPSALAEIGFLTNSKELSNLQNEEYQQKTAEALCDAIIKSLEKIGK
jgi:N-acetylmuramoyl-L-alanine amidase